MNEDTMMDSYNAADKKGGKKGKKTKQEKEEKKRHLLEERLKFP